MLAHQLVHFRAVVSAVSVYLVHIRTFDEIGQRLSQPRSVIGIVRFRLHSNSQLEVVFGVTRLGEIGHLADVTLATFLAVCSSLVVRRLQTAGAQLFALLGTEECLH